MLVGRRMSHDPKTIHQDASVAEATERMQRERVRRYPVLNPAGKLVGIVSLDDLLRASPSGVTSLNVWEISYLLSQVKVKDVMTKNVLTVTENTPLEEAAKLMLDNKIGGPPGDAWQRRGRHHHGIGHLPGLHEMLGGNEKGDSFERPGAQFQRLAGTNQQRCRPGRRI